MGIDAIEHEAKASAVKKFGDVLRTEDGKRSTKF